MEYHQNVNSLDPGQARHFVGLICFQTVCKSDQQKTLVGKELMSFLVKCKC